MFTFEQFWPHCVRSQHRRGFVYMTGAAADDWASEGVPNSILLKKPFAPAQLVTAVSQLLNAGSPTSG